MKKTGVISIFACFVLLIVFIQRTNSQNNGIFEKIGEAYLEVELEDQKQLFQLSGITSIDKVNDHTVIINVNESEFAELVKLGFNYKVLPHPNESFFPEMKGSPKAWDVYPTYDEYVNMMYQFQTDYPQLCQVFSIGQSINGRELLFARISDNAGTNENEPEFLYTATMHGDETAGYVLSLRLIDYLLSNYGFDPGITNLVNEIDIFINPLANPDGTYAGGNHTVSGATRRNANYVDLNRNYPDPEDGPHPDGNVWQTETIHFMNFAENYDIDISANMHGGAEVCNYPWDTWSTLAADDDWWILVCNEYADTAQFYSPPGYLDDFGTGITNGYQWYSIAGGRQDYMNYFHQCREFTLEMSSTKLLPESQLNNHWNYNYRSFLNYIEQSLFGVRGIVSDSITGLPIEAEVYVINHELDSSWVYSSLPAGNYHRLLYQGTYDIRFSAPGYFPKTIYGVQVVNRTTTLLDVALSPGNLIADFTASSTLVPVGSSIDFTDLSYGNSISWNWTFEGGNPSASNSQHPSGIHYSTTGTYSVSLTISDGTFSNTMTKTDYITVNEEFLMSNTTVTTCSGTFYDSGGAGSNYSDYEDYTFTIFPAAVNGKTKIIFSLFNVEYHSSCNYDWLKIYNGPDTFSPLIGEYCGTSSPGTVISTETTGALTFEFHSDYSENREGWVAAISCESEPILLNLKAFLEGPYNGSGMNTTLSQNQDFPFSQPYNTSPWNYNGTESIVSVPNNNIVDWLLVELRDATDILSATGTSVIATMAGFILSDGSVVETDGYSLPQFNVNYYNNLYVVLWHRNHLGVMSALPLNQAGYTFSYDFSTGPQQVVGGINGFKELATGVWGLSGGDGNADGQINTGDKNDVWLIQAGQSGYISGDFNLDVEVNNGDKVDIWIPNTGFGCQIPD
ncbi:MAG: PKD domain-containing protein [Bacteroidales bacterium]|nr:PKD domain-containing protein [Bacteroidales bacterium]